MPCQNSFKSFNFTIIYLSPLSFKCFQLRHIHQSLLNVTINCSIFQKFLIFFKLKNLINDWKIFSRISFKIIIKVDKDVLNE